MALTVILNPQMKANLDNFPALAGYLLCFGGPLGLVTGSLQRR
jgi:hypothetical protein